MTGGSRFTFDAFELDARTRRLTRDGMPLTLSERHCDVLLQLVSHPGEVLSKDALVDAAWRDVAVTDNSLEQAVSALRRMLGSSAYIQTVPRRGYRFTAQVTRTIARESDEALDALLAPHRAWIEGRAALESLEREQVARARAAFERLLSSVPDQAVGYLGLANACLMQFEMTRADPLPDLEALVQATRHAKEACRFDPRSGEAWATLAVVLDRIGHRVDALAASRRAVTLEPDNWRHHFRQALVSWGEERLRAARRTLALFPGFSLAHWLAATVLVARQVMDEAERELRAGAAAQDGQPAHSAFSAVALHWLLGLVHLARGDEAGAMAEFERELAFEGTGHLYGRECCANTWYAIGVIHLRNGRRTEARSALEQTLRRVPAHPLACVAVIAAGGPAPAYPDQPTKANADVERDVDGAFVHAAGLVVTGAIADAARLVERSLAAAAPGTSAGWTLPVEPLLNVAADPSAWGPALSRLRTRSA